MVLNGWGVGEQYNGGFAELARVSGDWLVPVPKGWTPADCMAVGVAGYTAMLCVMALEEQGVKPADGEVLVTGAAGGVGTTAIVILAHLGYKVIASTGRVSEEPFLKSLGAAGVVDRNEFNTPVKPLAKSRWAGCIDSVGSVTLANVISQMNPEGTVAACGTGAGHGSAHHGGALHPARRQAHRRQLGEHAHAAPHGGLVAHRPRSRPRQAQGTDHACEAR